MKRSDTTTTDGNDAPHFPEEEADLIRRDRCPICGGTHRGGPEVGTLRYRRCDDCGLVFMDPVPAQHWYDERYAAAYWEGQAKRESRAEETARRLRKEHLRAVTYVRAALGAGLPDRGSLLEVGCGAGGAVATLAQALGWEATGVEPDVESRGIARAVGVTVVGGTLDDLAGTGRTFDLILLSHVLEHVVDADTFLADLLQVLAPGGKLLIEVPNGMTNESLHLFHPYLFTRRALTSLLARHLLGGTVVAHGGAASRMRRHYLLAVVERTGQPRVRGLRYGRRLGQAWSRAWHRSGVLRRIDARLARRAVRPDEQLLAGWRRSLSTPEP